MIKIILSVLLFSFITSYSQTNIKGSYFIAAICKDGIVIGADTRGAVLDSLSRPYGYFDSVQKVFALKSTILAEAGYISLHQRFFADYIQEFKKKI